MKALKLIAFGIMMVAAQGCYTVLWTPDVALPTKDQSENDDSYYDEPYYGDYNPYYERPWWYSIPPPQRLIIPTSERTAQEAKIRNGNSPDRGVPERQDQPVINVGRPTVDQPSTTSPVTTPPTTTNDSSTKKTESTPPQREKGNTTNSRDTRNNDGSRSSDPPRR
ncbi:MAG: hypothetical protein WCS69_12070 [Ignavibacteriaceae bacterium]|jgi:hypothetical protein